MAGPASHRPRPMAVPDVVRAPCAHQHSGHRHRLSRAPRPARQPDATGVLTTWWSAARCSRHWGDIVTPDGYGRWHENGRQIEWFVEFDFGTEQLSRLADKLARYDRLAKVTGITTPVLVW